MNGEAPHPTGPRTGTGAATLRLFLWLFVLLGGLAVVLVLPAILVLTALGESRPGQWGVYIWVPLAFLAALFSVVAGLQAMAHPRPRLIVALAGIAVVAFLSYPPFWAPEG